MIKSCAESAKRELMIAERVYLLANGWECDGFDNWKPPSGRKRVLLNYKHAHAVNRQKWDDARTDRRGVAR